MLYRDLNGNGVIDSNEGLIATTSSNASGQYSFGDLPTGTYIVGANANTTRLSGSTQTTQRITGGVQPVNLTTTPSTGNNFGFYAPPGAATLVTLTSFTAGAEGSTIVLRWETAAEYNTLGFNVYRSITGKRADAVRITPNLILAQGDSVAGSTYMWTDTNVQKGTTYSYWLQDSESDGTMAEYGPTTISLASYHTFLPLVGMATATR